MSSKKLRKLGYIIYMDIKEMGYLFSVPFIVHFLLVLCSRLFTGESTQFDKLIPMMEGIIPALCSWWIIFSLKTVLEDEGGETLFSYSIDRKYIGFYKTLFFFLLYMLLSSITLLLVQLRIKEPVYAALWVQFFIQSLYFYGFTFIVILFTRRSEWSLFLVLSYTSTQFITEGKIFWFANIYLNNEQIILPREAFIKYSLCIVVSVILLIISTIKLNRYSNFK